MRLITKAFLLGLGLALSSAAHSAQLVYAVNFNVGAFGNVVGKIRTDGTLGTIASDNIKAWGLKLTGADGVTEYLNTSNSNVFSGGTALSAQDGKLLFDFGNSPSFLIFQKIFQSGASYTCVASGEYPKTPCIEGLSVIPGSFYTDPSSQYSNFVGVAPGTFGTASESPVGGVFTLGVSLGVPEPSTWAMLIAGFGMMGGMIRYRKVKVRYA